MYWRLPRKANAPVRVELSTIGSNSARECFVYITLPGKTSAVTAGKFVPEQTDSGTPLGRFVYGQSYLKNAEAVPIDPVALKLSNETYSTVHLKGVFGALRDAGPDYWGRRVIENPCRKTVGTWREPSLT